MKEATVTLDDAAQESVLGWVRVGSQAVGALQDFTSDTQNVLMAKGLLAPWGHHAQLCRLCTT